MVCADRLDHRRSLLEPGQTNCISRGGENAAAAAGSDLWHSNCTVKYSMDMEEVVEE